MDRHHITGEAVAVEVPNDRIAGRPVPGCWPPMTATESAAHSAASGNPDSNVTARACHAKVTVVNNARYRS